MKLKRVTQDHLDTWCASIEEWKKRDEGRVCWGTSKANYAGHNNDGAWPDCRYYFDFDVLDRDLWSQYDTKQDAQYFGVWVNPSEKQTLTYAEGDVTLYETSNEEEFKAELVSMSKFYGSPPPVMTGYDLEGNVTHYYDESGFHGRTVEDLT